MKDVSPMLRLPFLIVIFSVAVAAQQVSTKKEVAVKLIGVWQDGPVVGSGMGDNFQFFADGFYRFNYNEMDGTKRIISHSGSWKVSSKSITLTVKKVRLLIGGKWVNSSGSVATEFEIEGGKIFEKNIYPFETIDMSLGKFVKEKLHLTTKIDGIKYWKLSSDPKTYENE